MTAAADAAFADPAAMTAAFLVVHKGRIVAERYAPGITRDTQLESWSMGKSLAATLFALLVKDGTYTLEQPAPVPLWRAPGDPRGTIRNIDLLRMSAGLKFLGNQEPGSNQTYPDHYYIYTGGIDAFDYSITRPQEYPPNTDGRYRNSDPLTITYLAKLAVTKRGENFLTWPQRALFDRIGIRRQVLETDPYGNFLITGYDYGTARNWARIGLLYLQDGMWQGQRLLPEGWATFVSTPAPAWKRPEYGGFFWLNRINTWNLPARDLLRRRRRRAEHVDRSLAGSGDRPHGPHARPGTRPARDQYRARPRDGSDRRQGRTVGGRHRERLRQTLLQRG